MPGSMKPTVALSDIIFFMLKIQDIVYSFLTILIIKASCNVTGWEHILVDNLKVYVTHEEETFVSLESNYPFILNYF